MFAPKTVYSSAEGHWVLFDIRDDEAVRRFYRLRAGLQDDADVKALGPDHVLLVIRPGGATRRLVE